MDSLVAGYDSSDDECTSGANVSDARSTAHKRGIGSFLPAPQIEEYEVQEAVGPSTVSGEESAEAVSSKGDVDTSAKFVPYAVRKKMKAASMKAKPMKRNFPIATEDNEKQDEGTDEAAPAGSDVNPVAESLPAAAVHGHMAPVDFPHGQPHQKKDPDWDSLLSEAAMRDLSRDKRRRKGGAHEVQAAAVQYDYVVGGVDSAPPEWKREEYSLEVQRNTAAQGLGRAGLAGNIASKQWDRDSGDFSTSSHVSSSAKRKHQISFLAADAQARMKLLDASKASGRVAKQNARARYGW